MTIYPERPLNLCPRVVDALGHWAGLPLLSRVTALMLSAAMGFVSPVHSATVVSAQCSNIQVAGIPPPRSSCLESVSEGVPNQVGHHVGTLEANALTIEGPRKIGVALEAKATLDTVTFMDFFASIDATITMRSSFRMSARSGGGASISSGTMVIHFSTDGDLSLAGNALGTNAGGGLSRSFAALEYSMAVNGNSVLVGSHSAKPLGTDEFQLVGTSLGATARTVTVPWTSNRSMAVEMYLRATALAHLQNDGNVELNVNFGNSLDWLGISAVFDSSGTPVAEFSALSDDGVDWGRMAPVPLTGGLPLLAGTVLMLFGATARARKRPRRAVEQGLHRRQDTH